MTSRRRFLVLAGTVLALCVTTGVQLVTPAASLPARLSDGEFWRLVTESSEPDGFFRSDNLLSNEMGFQHVIPELARQTRSPDGCTMGVGPEQNFTYIVATRPAMVFIVDVRRGNLDLHLMYKALFELSADRAEFVSRLFSKARPDRPDREVDRCRDLRRVRGRPGQQPVVQRQPEGHRQPADEEARPGAVAGRCRAGSGTSTTRSTCTASTSSIPPRAALAARSSPTTPS